MQTVPPLLWTPLPLDAHGSQPGHKVTGSDQAVVPCACIGVLAVITSSPEMCQGRWGNLIKATMFVTFGV